MKWYKEIKNDKNIKLAIASIVFSIIFSIFLYPMLKEIVPNNEIHMERFVLLFFSVFLLAFFFSKLIGLLFSKHLVEEKIEDTLEKVSVKKYVNEILDSKEFISALRTTLPKGEKDNEHGLDHIPFLLQNSVDKRERYFSISKLFLIATVISTIIFTSVVIYFGYFLINDDSAGFYKALTDLKDKVEQTNEDYLGISNAAEFRINKISERIRDIVSRSYYQNINSQLSGIADSLNIKNSVQIDSALIKIENMIPYAKIDTSKKMQSPIPRSDILEDISEIRNDIKEISKDYRTYAERISNSLTDIKRIGIKLDNMEIPDKYSLGEILKRFFISIIVTTFLLAILRFLSNQYRNNYEKAIIADEENSLIRRFYVAYKASQNDNERSIAISKLVETQNFKEVIKASKEKYFENEMLKEIMSTIAKKL